MILAYLKNAIYSIKIMIFRGLDRHFFHCYSAFTMKQYTVLSAKRRSITRTAMIALFAALTAAGAFITVPLYPVPMVLQNLFPVLSGLVLGPLMGSAAVGLFLAAGALGAPVFSGGTGGIARFFGPTGGFLLGYLLAAAVAGLIVGRPRRDKRTPGWRIALAAALGFVAIYVPGLLRLHAVTGLPWLGTLTAGFFPFIPGDIIKGIAATLAARQLRRVVADHLDS